MEEEIREAIAYNLRYYRKAILEMTQKEVADEIGFSSTAVSQNERGENLPTILYLLAFAKLAGVTLDKLCGVENETIVVNGLKENDIREIETQIRRRGGSHKRR